MSRRLTTIVVVLLALFLALALVLSTFPPPAGGQEPQVRSEPLLRGLEFPTNLAFAPDGRLFFNEKETGRVRILRDGHLLAVPFDTLPVIGQAERGLLGLAIHPDFEEEPWVYVYLSDATDGRNRVLRTRAVGDLGVEREVLLDLLSSVSGYHNGGDLNFGPDGMLYVTTGEAHDPRLAQDPSNLGGKVLRIEPDGSIPADNPFGPDSPVFALGFRNSFGVCVDGETGQVWVTDNGPERDDEVNRVEPGGNHGWPDHLGFGGEPAFVDPVLVYEQVIVPTGCAVVPRGDGRPGRVVFGDYRGSLRLVQGGPDGPATARVVATFPSGITDVTLGPDGALYVATSDAIHRVVGLEPPEEPSPTPTDADPPTPTPTPTPSPIASPTRTDGGTGLVPVLIGTLAALALAGGLAYGLRYLRR